ncbi:hypothetical protein H4W79_004394 [Nocardiopsis terrae]|uniref:Uncharacterized protein n=1 Tax=Nocardiopsis terrae TaxID=372655 RepID=A0ABR9HMB2_9ACTN|nr:hypothetical protein [Nocardiopsis terrae]MBE1460180.1 hypothetical protein [Nocardiopsis terrae]
MDSGVVFGYTALLRCPLVIPVSVFGFRHPISLDPESPNPIDVTVSTALRRYFS